MLAHVHEAPVHDQARDPTIRDQLESHFQDVVRPVERGQLSNPTVIETLLPLNDGQRAELRRLTLLGKAWSAAEVAATWLLTAVRSAAWRPHVGSTMAHPIYLYVMRGSYIDAHHLLRPVQLQGTTA